MEKKFQVKDINDKWIRLPNSTEEAAVIIFMQYLANIFTQPNLEGEPAKVTGQAAC